MEQYDVRIFPTAQQDLMDVIDYLNTLSKEAALNSYDRLVSEIASLSTMPERCPRPDRKSTRLNSSHSQQSRMPSSA